MSWTIARLGSRFTLLFEPYQQRVMHSALGRFLDQPLDLMVGMIEPDGTRRVLPFTQEPNASPLHNAEQFERPNSITYRGYSETYGLRFEFNVHSVFYPQDERLCLMPAFYLEMRVNPAPKVRWHKPAGPTPDKVKLFIRLRRPDTEINACYHGEGDARQSCIDLAYRNRVSPKHPFPTDLDSPAHESDREVQVHERIVSLNPECELWDDENGLTCELPVTEGGSGIKWRLVWATHVAEPVLDINPGKPGDGETVPAPFRYNSYWANLDEVLEEAFATRDDHLALSRRFEKLIEQAPLTPAQYHLLAQSFHSWLANTFWCQYDGGAPKPEDWFSVWEGSCFYHSTLDVEYNVSLVYLSLWPQLLALQFDQWSNHGHAHEKSGGRFLSHDLGQGAHITGQAYPHHMPVEENANYLLLLHAYTHWTGDRTPAHKHKALVADLVRYLLWTDRDQSGFPSEGVANTIDDASPAVQFGNKQTYLAVKRVAALRSAAALLTMTGDEDLALHCEDTVKTDLRKIEAAAWLGDHYAVCVDASAAGVTDAWTGKPLPYDTLPGWDGYSIYTANGQLLPMLVGAPPLLDEDRLKKDLVNAIRENLTRYGCGHTSSEVENVWVSQNIWRDHLTRYLGLASGLPSSHYWDMQVMSNTHNQSLGFVDTYINNYLCHYPRGIVSIGYLLAGPRLVIDRLSPGGAYITVDPDRGRPQRWPLLALADWKAGKIPVCVVDDQGNVTIEGKIDPIVIQGADADSAAANAGLIG
ncbi:glutaminase domain-containing protein [Phycisphaerales bacterium AB-hyl4]|uniref:Glutaminase domain-containing protein n=1 Tax=Natronomicrosphaera hydrolytica TaxID=3242702 RepID=A0ABV4U1U5_9BACT